MNGTLNEPDKTSDQLSVQNARRPRPHSLSWLAACARSQGPPRKQMTRSHFFYILREYSRNGSIFSKACAESCLEVKLDQLVHFLIHSTIVFDQKLQMRWMLCWPFFIFGHLLPTIQFCIQRGWINGRKQHNLWAGSGPMRYPPPSPTAGRVGPICCQIMLDMQAQSKKPWCTTTTKIIHRRTAGQTEKTPRWERINENKTVRHNEMSHEK